MAPVQISNSVGASSQVSAKPSIFVMDPYHRDAIAALRTVSDIDVVLPGDTRRSNFHQDATILLLRSETHVTADDNGRSQKLQAIVKQLVGIDNIDTEAATNAGIKVSNTPGLNSESVAEHSMSLALALARRIPEIDRRVRAGEALVRSQLLGMSLYRKTLGLVGMGNIAIAFAKKWLSAMDGHIICYDPFVDEDAWSSLMTGKVRRVSTLNELLEIADVVSLHVPLTESTTDLLSFPQLEKMKHHAILINAARGGIVNETALAEALRSGHLWGVGLDAMVIEPPTRESCGELFEFPNVLITPHIGASTMENQSRSGVAAAEIALGLTRGKETGNRIV